MPNAANVRTRMLARIAASANSVTVVFPIARVAPPATVTDITITPVDVAVIVGRTSQLTAEDQFGNVLTTGVTWVSSDPSKATVDSTGLVTGIAEGVVQFTGTYYGAASAPINPLLGVRPASTLVPHSQTPEHTQVTMPCLWYDMVGMSDSRHNAAAITGHKWSADSDAVFLVSKVAAQQGTGTVFDACDHIEAAGNHFAVLGITPYGPGLDAHYAYYVWVKGARKQ